MNPAKAEALRLYAQGDLTHEQVAARVGRAPSTVSAWLRGIGASPGNRRPSKYQPIDVPPDTRADAGAEAHRRSGVRALGAVPENAGGSMTHIKPDAWTYYEMTPERMAAWFKQQSDDQIRVLAAHHVWYPGGPPRPEPALPRQVSVRDIIAECAAIGGLAFGDIVGARRTKDIIPYRHAAAYLAAIHCRHISLPSIGKRFGGRDHTTILSACNRVKEDLAAGGERFGAIVGRAEKRLALR